MIGRTRVSGCKVDLSLLIASEFIEPRNYRSALELIVPGTWTAIHG